MNRKKQFGLTISLAAAAMVMVGLGIAGARADDDEHEYEGKGRSRITATNPVWKEECGSCHIAYPPRMLPASSWKQIMSSLDKHFGSDASLDKKTADQITAFLERNAGRERAVFGEPNLRITKSRWFLHEHDEISARTWHSPKVKSPSNCEACHADAAKGNFNEHRVRIPR
jgi:hypothetical protein